MPEVVIGAAKMQAEVGHIYTVNFDSKRDMKLVFKQAVGGEWALVQEATASGVSVGSALVAVNGESVELEEHTKVIQKIRSAEFPAELTFRKAPSFDGVLRKKAQGLQGKVKNWKTRYFFLEYGLLSYYSDDRRRKPNDVRSRVRRQGSSNGSTAPEHAAGAEFKTGSPKKSSRWRGKQQQPKAERDDRKGNARSSNSEKGFFPLSGAALRVVPRAECGRNHCFQLTGGAGRLLLQASSAADFYQWCAVLYHALGVANGCGFILEMAHEKAIRVATQNTKRGFLQQIMARQTEAEEAAALVEAGTS
jgi:hypothetical protein